MITKIFIDMPNDSSTATFLSRENLTLDYRPVAARYAIEDIGRLIAGEHLKNEITRSRSAVMSKKQ